VAENTMAKAPEAKAGGAAQGHTEAEGGHKGGFPPFQSDNFASQLVSFAVAFVLLYVIVSRIALPRMRDVLTARQGAIDGDLAEAQRLRDQSDVALKAYESELAGARARAQGIGTEIRNKLGAEAETNRKALEARLATKLAEAEKSIAATRSAAMSNVREIAADAAAAIVQRLTGGSPETAAVERAVDSALKG
jgi:F-type H+-transporting ATPase subunit b